MRLLATMLQSVSAGNTSIVYRGLLTTCHILDSSQRRIRCSSSNVSSNTKCEVVHVEKTRGSLTNVIVAWLVIRWWIDRLEGMQMTR
jgi:hypothetical protein